MASDAYEQLTPIDVVDGIVDTTSLVGETVRRVLDALVPSFADVIAIDVVAPTGELRRLGVRCDGPERERFEAMLSIRHHGGDPAAGVLRAVATGESQLISPVGEPMLRGVAGSAEDLEMLRSMELRSTIFAPLTARGRVVGALVCSTRTGREPFGSDDLAMAESLAARIGLALDNAGLPRNVSGLDRRLELTLANLSGGVVVRDPDGTMVFANQAAAELFGIDIVESLFAASDDQLTDQLAFFDENNVELPIEEMPTRRVLRGEPSATAIYRVLQRRPGVSRWLRYTSSPVHDEDGRLTLVVTMIEDVSREKSSELAQRLLAGAGRELATTLDERQSLQLLAELVTPDLADWCLISLLAADGTTMEVVGIGHADRGRIAGARAWMDANPAHLDEERGAASVLRSGLPVLVRDIDERYLPRVPKDGDRPRFGRTIGMHSVVVVPLRLPGERAFGTLSLIMAESTRKLGSWDLAVAGELGVRAAMAVQNARLFAERSRIAAILQRSLLPGRLPTLPGITIESLYRPAGEQDDVGGDFYDVFPVGDGWLVLVGDVTGHGAGAAALTALARHTLRTAAKLLGDPIAAIAELNAALREQPELSLVTACCLVVHARDHGHDVQVILAGHPPAYHIHDGVPAQVGTPAPLLGVDDAVAWRADPIPVAPGDVVVLYTDGVIDTRSDSGVRFGEERLTDVLTGVHEAPEAMMRIVRELSNFGETARHDDTAVLALQFGEPAG